MNVREMIPAADDASDLMRSLSHPQRLLVLCALGKAEKSVAELREELEIDQVPDVAATDAPEGRQAGRVAPRGNDDLLQDHPAGGAHW